ncbi:MAG: ATP-binding protein [Gammaproteobacteria bacterium]|nr:ATP-binding protein [Gammaproteobacteria bacterium]MCY4357522.1 ATP-binding protein [Gammaproteobacteria bacterium]
MYKRLLENLAKEALLDTPVVLIVGPRRSGKTTLVNQIEKTNRTYVTLDDPAALEGALADPTGFIRSLGVATIDEVQRAPELLLAIKRSVDENYGPGRFLLTGSANVMTFPQVADSLAGRIETLRLLPLAQAEILGTKPTFLNRLFIGKLGSVGDAIIADELIRAVLLGGFPEAISRNSETRRQTWGRAWLESVISRDLRDMAQVGKMNDLPKFMSLLAEYSGKLINYSQLGAAIGASHKTGQRYLNLLEQLFIVSMLSPWHTNRIKRIVKTPKLHFIDSGLLAATKGILFDKVQKDRTQFGSLLENFVLSEILKLISVSEMHLNPYHFREQQKREVDIVLERNDGMVAGIEVKASATVRASDFSGLKTLAAACGDRFAYGVVLYDSADFVPFGERFGAAPISVLWE